MTPRPAPVDIHASCVLVGEAGILLRGASGSGKSSLARHLVALAAARGQFARLVGDDRIVLSVAGGRLLASPHPALAGALEVRGVGLLAVPFAAGAVVRLVVECDAAPERWPEPSRRRTVLCGLTLPCLAVGPDDADKVLMQLAHPASSLESEPLNG